MKISRKVTKTILLLFQIMPPVLRRRGEVEQASPARHLPVRVIRGVERQQVREEPRVNPVRVAMGPASEMVRRALREQERQEAVQGEEDDGHGGDEEREG